QIFYFNVTDGNCTAHFTKKDITPSQTIYSPTKEYQWIYPTSSQLTLYISSKTRILIGKALDSCNLAEAEYSQDGKLITINHFDTLTAAKRICKKLDFSPDKQWLLVGLDNKCIIIPTPLELSYGVKTTNQIFTAYYCLRNTKEMDILTDIIQIIIGTMLDCS